MKKKSAKNFKRGSFAKSTPKVSTFRTFVFKWNAMISLFNQLAIIYLLLGLNLLALVSSLLKILKITLFLFCC